MVADLVGRQIENYLIDGLLGEGGMSAVYRGHDVNLARQVAIKVIHSHLARNDEFQRRFLQEARALARLGNHPSIVEIYTFGRHSDLFYIVMEFVPGSSLGVYFRQSQKQGQVFELTDTLIALAQVAEALGYAHRHDVIHRDVKPDNVLLRPLDETLREVRQGELPFRPVLIDFGLANMPESEVETPTGTLMGTLPYMSPEQSLGEKIDSRSDLYSLGIVLYQLATGRLPFETRSVTDAIEKHVREQPPPPQDIRPELTSVVAEIIEKSIAKNPADRFQTGEEMAEALRMAVSEPALGSAENQSLEGASLWTRSRPGWPTHAPTESEAARAPGRIFVSYRRDDAAGFAGRLYDRLAASFGEERMFMDIDAILPGEDFVDVINRELDSCVVLLAVIGPGWLSAADAAGRPRLDNPDDFVRLEIGKALERNIRVIPVLWQRAVMPRSNELPKELAKLARRNAVEVEHASFQRDLAPLIAALEQLLAMNE